MFAFVQVGSEAAHDQNKRVLSNVSEYAAITDVVTAVCVQGPGAPQYCAKTV